MREPTFRRPQSLYETVRTIYFHHFSWSHKCILCKHYTTFELSLIYSTLYMPFPRQPLLFTETVPHNSYETVEGNLTKFGWAYFKYSEPDFNFFFATKTTEIGAFLWSNRRADFRGLNRRCSAEIGAVGISAVCGNITYIDTCTACSPYTPGWYSNQGPYSLSDRLKTSFINTFFSNWVISICHHSTDPNQRSAQSERWRIDKLIPTVCGTLHCWHHKNYHLKINHNFGEVYYTYCLSSQLHVP